MQMQNLFLILKLRNFFKNDLVEDIKSDFPNLEKINSL